MMNRRVAFPFLTLSNAAVQAAPWSFSLNNGEWQVPGDFMPDWDSASVIRLHRMVRIDPNVAADDLGISPDELRLSLSVCIGTGQGRLPRLIILRERRELAMKIWQEEFEVEVAGEGLSSVLDVLTQVTLAGNSAIHGPLSPQRVGDRLWSDALRVRLEGEELRFPIEIADTRKLLGATTAASAPWYLHWSPRDWNRDFHGAIRLYLNANCPDFIRRIEEEDVPTLQVLLADVMGQICERLVVEPEAREIMVAAEPGSLGAQATAWLNKGWPGRDLAFIRSVIENRPGTFRAVFLALAELGEV